MPIPQHTLNPPFNILRASHVALTVTDLGRSRAFYEEILGLHVEHANSSSLYLRGYEERQHHSIILYQANAAQCARLGFRVGTEADIDKAAHYFRNEDITHEVIETPYQGRTLAVTDPFGLRLQFYASMEPATDLLRRYDLYKGCHPQRLDHFNIFAAELQETLEFYVDLGFRVSEYAEEDGTSARVAAAWLHRKGNVHDLALTNGHGPRLHHVAYWVPSPMNILHLCDVMAASGYVKNIERGPGRHGISNAFFLYIRDPDGHRIELYTNDYSTIDYDHTPLRWSLTDPRRQTLWGAPAPRSWFEQGTPFVGEPVREPQFTAEVTIAD